MWSPRRLKDTYFPWSIGQQYHVYIPPTANVSCTWYSMQTTSICHRLRMYGEVTGSRVWGVLSLGKWLLYAVQLSRSNLKLCGARRIVEKREGETRKWRGKNRAKKKGVWVASPGFVDRLDVSKCCWPWEGSTPWLALRDIWEKKLTKGNSTVIYKSIVLHLGPPSIEILRSVCNSSIARL